MKICPVCQAQLADDLTACPRCGTACAPVAPEAPAPEASAAPEAPAQPAQPTQSAPAYYVPPMTPPYPVYVDPSDHTAEFDDADIHENKLYAMLAYLVPLFGILIGVLAAKDSPYVCFHIKQAIKIVVLQVLVGLISGVFFWTVIAPIAGAVCLIILAVVAFICFCHVCGNKAKEAPIVKGFGFLK